MSPIYNSLGTLVAKTSVELVVEEVRGEGEN
jgi:hypothetical protein